jgi:hypothetical protein
LAQPLIRFPSARAAVSIFIFQEYRSFQQKKKATADLRRHTPIKTFTPYPRSSASIGGYFPLLHANYATADQRRSTQIKTFTPYRRPSAFIGGYNLPFPINKTKQPQTHADLRR